MKRSFLTVSLKAERALKRVCPEKEINLAADMVQGVNVSPEKYYTVDQYLYSGKGIRTPDPLHAISRGRFQRRPLPSNCDIDTGAVVHTRLPTSVRCDRRCLHGC